MSPDPRPVVGIIGAGRAGVGLGLALAKAGYRVHLSGRRAKPVPAPLAFTVLDEDEAPAWLAQAGVVVLAVRDDAIGPAAKQLKKGGGVGRSHVVLHLSGVQGQEALGALVSTGAALGSLHPLQTITSPERAPERLRGAWAAVEGMPRAVEAAERLARDLGLKPFQIPGKKKAVYHAAAVFASNYFVVVEAVAQRLLRHAGLSDADAWEALRPLVAGTFENLMRDGPQAALTGPVTRGDADTIERHARSLTADDAGLYRALARAALQIAKKRGLDRKSVTRVAEVLATVPPPARRREGQK
ncbi:MAG TPA: Rossmann-like and DUF2520 domain-containing protein [Gemmatimonadales bacterium]|nr:Rossmann-like and DUF2520 domain-containing protein [Gemmatimonadales bacterium]